MANQFKCGRCGTMISFGTTQCPKCGQTFRYASAQKAPSDNTTTQRVDNTTTRPASSANAHTTPHYGNRKLWGVIAVMALVILVLFIIAIKPLKEKESSEQTEMGDSTARQQLTQIAMPFAKRAGKDNAQVVINGEGVRLRFKPSLKAGYLTWENGRGRYLDKGTKLKYISETDEWYEVEYEGHHFFVSKQYSYLE